MFAPTTAPVDPPLVTVKQCRDLVEKWPVSKRKIISSLRWLFSHEKNFETYCRFFFSDAFTKPFTKAHHEVIIDLQHPRNVADALPRGFGKSTLVGHGFVMWLVCNKKEHYLVYTSQNHRKSIEFVEPIRRSCKTNKLLRFVYPELDKLGTVRDDEGRDREDCYDINGIRIEAISFDKDIRGLRYGVHRPTRIILDDIENRERTTNKELRIKDELKLNSDIIPALDPVRGVINFIGTILHPDSLLSKKIKSYKGQVYRAEYPDGTLLWPEVFTREKLDSLRRDIGSLAYAQEYLNNPGDAGITLFRRKWLDDAKDETLSVREDDRLKYDFKVQGVDFAFSDRITADSSAFGGIGKHYSEDEPRYDVIQLIWKQGMSITEQLDYIEYLNGLGGYHDNALEENSIRSMSKELRHYKFDFTLFWTAGSDAKQSKPFEVSTDFSMKRYTVGKAQMLMRMATLFENGLVKLPYKTDRDKDLTDKFAEECMTFALDDGKLVEASIHADMPIAIGYALERAELQKQRYAFASVTMGQEELLFEDRVPPDQAVSADDEEEEDDLEGVERVLAG